MNILTPFPQTDSGRPAFFIEVTSQGYTTAHANYLADIFYPKQRINLDASTTRRTTQRSTAAKEGRKKK